MKRIFQLRNLAPFGLGVMSTLLVLYVPVAFFSVLEAFLPRPAVSSDWVKARSFEYLSSGREPRSWPAIGPRQWYFRDVKFGLREFETDNKDRLLVISPDGDGPHAYILTSQGELLESRDDAMSLNCEWKSVASPRKKVQDILRFRGGFEPVK